MKDASLLERFRDDPDQRLVIITASILGLLLVVLLGRLMFNLFLRKMNESGGNRLKDNTLPVSELKELQGRGLLTPEEAKKVREAMARQFLEERKLAEQSRNSGGLSPVAALMLEAERAKGANAKKESESAPPQPSGKDAIPRRLHGFLELSSDQLEKLLLEGILSREDLLAILDAKE
jgi:hypothetical protein